MTENFSMDRFLRSYDTDTLTVKIRDRKFKFLKPKSIDRFINPDDVINSVPIWAKIWEASGILANYMAVLPVKPDRRILELGAGLGVAGITAAAAGHHVTLTEYNPDALNFLRANVRLNHCHNAKVCRLDWQEPDINGRFDWIIGSEIIYKQSDIQSLLCLFDHFLNPNGTILLSEQVRSTGVLFLERMDPYYDIRIRKHTMASANDSQVMLTFELRPKKNGATTKKSRHAIQDGQ